MVDPGRLRALLGRLAQRIRQLQPYSEKSAEEYVAEEKGVLASKYLLVTAIEDILAVATHIISSEALRSPTSYSDAFGVLVENQLLDRELGERLANAARFRNLLIHVYAEVDDRRVHRFLTDDLSDLTSFARAVLGRFPEIESGR